ncbi:BURP domain-containing protein 5-like [Mercurialis annua]|uniref:BURP domain-containing protein 5-like n=1 Tax=Mercurialis annua TaxID=3986 RepID=UPI00215FA4D1|nr:BURP domain-containing protein 5-like [Mercurialis annua]
MELHLILMFTLCLLYSSNTNGALPEEEYWKSKLPNTPLPNALQELLQSAENAGNISKIAEVVLMMPPNNDRGSYDVGYWNALNTSPRSNIMQNETTIWLLYNDLRPNKKMKLIFTKSINGSKFLPRIIADSMPFSSNKSQEIFDHFSIKPTSKEAQIINQTIEGCEAPSIRGEAKYCATSLESLVDFVTANLGTKVRAFSNEVEEENKEQDYTILNGIKMIGDNQIVCHKEIYKYVIYYCHAINATRAYMVPMVANNGSKVKAIVVCHSDTSPWNPKHFAFKVLNIKPGGPPICHFTNTDTIVWVPI